MHPDSMSGTRGMGTMSASQSESPPQSHMHGAVTRIDGLVGDIEQTLEVLQARLEPVVFHRPSEALDMVGNDKPLYAPLASEIHNLADRLEKIRGSLTHTLGSLEV